MVSMNVTEVVTGEMSKTPLADAVRLENLARQALSTTESESETDNDTNDTEASKYTFDLSSLTSVDVVAGTSANGRNEYHRS